jgi:hypothetical protein
MDNEQKQLLKTIMDDKFSNGAFCGMIFNAQVDAATKGQTVSTEYLIERALSIRLKALEMSK